MGEYAWLTMESTQTRFIKGLCTPGDVQSTPVCIAKEENSNSRIPKYEPNRHNQRTSASLLVKAVQKREHAIGKIFFE
jgi:hypothetical protein